MDLSDPDVVARAYVMQWMHENGLHIALKALEKEVGLMYDDTQLPEASQLMQLVWRHVEERIQQEQQLEEEGGDGGNEGHDDGSLSDKGGEGGAEEGRRDPGDCLQPGPNAEQSRRRQQQHWQQRQQQQRQRQQQQQRQRQQQEEALRLLRSGDDDYAGRNVVAEVPAEVHRANVIAVRMVPEQSCVITAAGDGCVRCVRWYGTGDEGGDSRTSGGSDTDVLWTTRIGSSALLTVALHPNFSRGLPLVAVGGMDGRVTVLHGSTGTIIATLQPHSKYVVRVVWSPATTITTGTTTSTETGDARGDGGGDGGSGASSQGRSCERRVVVLASASTDETVAILRLDLDYLDPNLDFSQSGGGEGPGAADDAGGDGSAGSDGAGGGGVSVSRLAGNAAGGQTGRMTIVRLIPYSAAVTDITFLCDGTTGSRTGKPDAASSSSSSGCGSTLVVSVRGSNYLRLLDVGRVVIEQATAVASGGSGSGGSVPESLINLNESGDDHVSFTAKHLAASHCGKYLLVCMDTPRLLVLRRIDWSVLRVIFGPPLADQFPQPVAAWHRDSNYIYTAGGAGAQLNVFHLGSGRLVHTSVHHRINVRGVDYDPHRNLLATCSFDKTVKLLAATPQPPAPAAVAVAAVKSG